MRPQQPHGSVRAALSFGVRSKFAGPSRAAAVSDASRIARLGAAAQAVAPCIHKQSAALRLLVVSLCLAWLRLPCRLVLAEDDAGDYRYTENITVTSENPELEVAHTIDTPSFLTVIELKDQAARYQSVADVLASAVGVNVRDFGGAGKLQTISIRGAGSNQVIVMLDGVTLNSAANGSVDLSTIPLQEVERIEIRRGGGEERIANGAIGGIVNIVTKKATANPHTSVTAEAGSFSTLSGGATRSGPAGPFTYLLHANAFHTEGDFTFRNDHGAEFGGETTTEHRRNNQTDFGGGLLELNGRLGPHSTLSFTNEFFLSDKGIPGMVTFPSLHASQQDQRLMSVIAIDHETASASPLKLGLSLHYLHTALHFSDPQGEQTGVPIESRQQDNSAEGQLSAAWLCSENATVNFIFGEQLEKLHDNTFGDKQRTTASGSFGSDLMFWRDRLWFKPALRYDRLSGIGGEFSPRLGIRAKVTSLLSLKANISLVFRAPSFNELYMSSGFVVGNEDLVSERGIAADLGLMLTAPHFTTEFALFQNTLHDLIQYVLMSRFQFKPLNIGRARSRGIEWQCSWQPLPRQTVNVTYCYNEATDLTADPLVKGKQIPGHPLHDLFLKLESGLGSFVPFAEGYYMSGNYLTRSNSKLLDDRFGVNLGVNYQPSARVLLTLELKNLTGQLSEDVRGLPLPSRSVFLGATLQW